MAANKPLMAALLLAALIVSSAPTASATTVQMQTSANPIRRVVDQLQAMQRKVKDEGEKSQELFDKYMCYCKKTEESLSKSIDKSDAQLDELPSAIDSMKGKQEHLKKDYNSHKEDKAEALAATEQAKTVRNKEHNAFTKEYSEENSNLKAVNRAIELVGKGMSSSFLQTPAAGVLRAYITKNGQSVDSDRQGLLAFLSGQQGDENEEPGGGEILGVLKAMADELKEEKAHTQAEEEESVKETNELLSAKKKETGALTSQLEDELTRLGDVGVALVQKKNDLDDAKATHEEDTSFLAELKKNCAAKRKVHEEENTMRQQELIALAETIELLNSDDALELFKKALPSSSSSFLQLQTTAASMRAQARSIISEARAKVRPGYNGAERLDFIELALSGRKAGGLDEVVKMVDGLIVTLENDQKFDDRKKEYCAAEMDTTEDKAKETSAELKGQHTVEDEVEDGIATTKEDIATLKKSISYLDMTVEEATQTRKEEHVAYEEEVAANSAAKDLIRKAKNRMAKLYNSLAQVSSDGAPPPPPETGGAYKQKQGGGVMAMMETLVQDLDKEMIVAKADEKASQAAYERAMADSKKKRWLDKKSVDDQESSRAALDTEKEDIEGDIRSNDKELMTIREMLTELHAECDWLVQYYDERKQARTEEIESLKKGKSILQGASVSLVQVSSSRVRAHKFLAE